MNRDPIGEEGGLNLYAFVGNDSVNRIDFLGMSAGPLGPGDKRFSGLSGAEPAKSKGCSRVGSPWLTRSYRSYRFDTPETPTRTPGRRWFHMLPPRSKDFRSSDCFVPVRGFVA